MDYYDHDEGDERKQMQHSGGAARIYRSGQDESGSGGSGSGSEDSGSGIRIANEDDNGDDYDEDEALDLVNF